MLWSEKCEGNLKRLVRSVERLTEQLCVLPRGRALSSTQRSTEFHFRWTSKLQRLQTSCKTIYTKHLRFLTNYITKTMVWSWVTIHTTMQLVFINCYKKTMVISNGNNSFADTGTSAISNVYQLRGIKLMSKTPSFSQKLNRWLHFTSSG